MLLSTEYAYADQPVIESFSPPPISQHEHMGRIPLSFAQERIWFIDKLQGSVQYHMPWVFRMHGLAEPDVLEYAFREIVRRHEVLRTVIREEDGVGYQEVLPAEAWKMTRVDGNDILAMGISTDDYIRELVEKPFDLAMDSMLRVGMVSISATESILAVIMHHIATDEWSVGIVVQELIELYNSRIERRRPILNELPIQYADFALWQRRYLNGEILEAKLSYWKEQLQDIAPLELPSDHVRPAEQSIRGGVVQKQLDKGLSEGLAGLCRKEQVTMFMLLLSVFKVLIYRYSGQTDICVGTPIAGRQQQEMEGLIGYFVNTLALRSEIRGSMRFSESLQEVKKTMLDAYDHQEVPFERIVESLGIVRDISRNPLFQLMFVMQESAGESEGLHLNGVTLTAEDPGSQTTLVDMSLYATESPAGLLLNLFYCCDVFEKDTAGRMLDHFVNLLQAICTTPHGIIDKLRMIGRAEENQLLDDFNKTHGHYTGDKTILDFFDEQVQKTPDVVAVVFEGIPVTYRQLDERSGRLARYLRSKGVREEAGVPLCMERSSEMVVAILGILKAGGAYIPLDPGYPRDWLKQILEDISPAIIVTGEKEDKIIKEALGRNAEVVNIVRDHADIERQGCEGLLPAPSIHQLAYIIYTSGSTGRPKGVMIEHGNLGNFIAAMDQALPLDPSDHLLAITSISFDISIVELLWTLCRGVRVTIAENGGQPDHLDRYLEGSVAVADMDFSLFYFSSQEDTGEKNKYDLLLRSVEYADKNAFSGIWLPERHFHEFGGIFPNPAVLGAALAAVTKNIEIRSGSVVLPLHDVVRVAEEWSVVDNLSNGRVSLSIASGWHADDFVLMPHHYEKRQEVMYRQIQELKALWQGASVKRTNGLNKEIDVRVFPRPVNPELPVWITTGGNPETYKSAGRIGANILTHLLGQRIEDLEKNIIIYKRALKENGHSVKDAKVALMLHTYIGEDHDTVKAEVREPFKAYLRSSVDLLKNLAKSMDTGEEKARGGAGEAATRETGEADSDELGEAAIDEILEAAFERYWQTSAILGTVESCKGLVERLAAIGVTEIACLVDFGVETEKVMNNLPHLNAFRKLFNKPDSSAIGKGDSKSAEKGHSISALQITPSYLNALLEDDKSQLFLKRLEHIIAGGEKLTDETVEKLSQRTMATIHNVYGPTETTIWSSIAEIRPAEKITIGKPVLNTRMYILDAGKNACPIGVPGELYIGGAGVARGYLNREGLTRERFVPEPFLKDSAGRAYRTGDMARWRPNGDIEWLGRNDDQIKLRGHRIEPGEVEKVIGQCGGVKKCVVALKEDTGGNKILVGYLQTEAGFDRLSLPEYLKSKLPAFMIPSLFVELERLPLTRNGKIDKKALPAPDVNLYSRKEYTAPRDSVEEKLVNIWQELLGIPRVSIHDDFFALGGHSLLAFRVVSSIRKALNVELPVKALFQLSDVMSLARAIRIMQGNTGTVTEEYEEIIL